jgi:hypothetical protein
MVKIPQRFITKGVEATESAKKAVARIENSVKQEVITPSRLVREPDSDLFEKASYMTKDEFWNDYSNSIMNEANRHRLGLPVSERFANDTLIFDEKTGRVKQHISNSGKNINNFAEDGRTIESNSLLKGADGLDWEIKTAFDANGNRKTIKEYVLSDGKKKLDRRKDFLSDGTVRECKYGFDENLYRIRWDNNRNAVVELNSDGKVIRYTKNN